LNIAMGPVGWAIAAVSTVTAGVVAYTSAADAAAESVFQFARNQEELNAKLAQSPLNRTTEDVQQLQSDYEKINGLLRDQKTLTDSIEKRTVQLTEALGVDDKALMELAEWRGELEEINDQLAVFGIDT